MSQLAIDFSAPIDRARAGRDSGMQRAQEHAEDVAPGWADRAFAALCAYAKLAGRFTSYEFRMTAYSQGLDAPPTDKAFGPVFLRAVKAGVIQKTGYAQHPERHASPTPVWERA